MRIVECPVCGRKYRFDDAKMAKEKIRVKCRKCENIFTIQKDMFGSAETSSSAPKTEPSAPPSIEDRSSMALKVTRVPNETARLRIATKLIPFTHEKMPALLRRLSKTPALFHCELTVTESDNLLRTIRSVGAEADLAGIDSLRRPERHGRGDLPKGRSRRWGLGTILIVLVVAAGGLSYGLCREVHKTNNLAQRGIDCLFPATAILYVRLQDLERHWGKGQEHPATSGLQTLGESLKSAPLVQGLLSRKREWERGWNLPFLRFRLMDVLGSDVRMALYKDRSSDSPALLLTLRGNLKTKLMEMLGKWIAAWQGRLSSRQIAGGQRVYCFQPEGFGREIYVYSEGLVYVVGTSLPLMGESMSLLRRELPSEKSLQSVPALAQKGERTGLNQIGLFYVGFGNLIESDMAPDEQVGAASTLKLLECYGNLVGTISYGRGLVVEATMPVRLEKAESPLRALVHCPPGPNKTLAYLPDNTILYVTNNGFDPPAHFSWLRKGLGKDRDSSFDRILQEIREKGGVDVEKDLLPFLGRGLSYAVLSETDDGGARLPSIQVFLEVRDRSKVEGFLQHILKRSAIQAWFGTPDVEPITIDDEGVPITCLRYRGDDPCPFILSLFSPCYAFMDEFLVMGTGFGSLKDTVDVAGGGGTALLKNPRFNEVKHLIRGQSSGLAYVDLRGISRLAQGIVGGGALANLVSPGGEEARDLHSILEVLSRLDFIWGKTEFNGDQVRLMLYIGPGEGGRGSVSPAEGEPTRAVTAFSS